MLIFFYFLFVIVNYSGGDVDEVKIKTNLFKTIT